MNLRRPVPPSAALFVLALLGLLFGAYLTVLQIQELEPGDVVLGAWSLSFQLLVCMWVRSDAEQRGAMPSRSFGFSLFFLFLFLLPWYLLSTRRWRGFVVMVGIALLYALPFVGPAVVAFFLD